MTREEFILENATKVLLKALEEDWDGELADLGKAAAEAAKNIWNTANPIEL